MRAAGSTALAHRGSANEYWLTFTWLQVQKDWNRSQNKKPFPNNSASLDFLPPTLAGFCRRARGLRVRVARARGERVKNISCAGHYAAATLFQGERCARFESTATPSPPPLPRRGEQQFSFGTNSQQRTSARRSPSPTGLANNCTSADKCVRSLADASSSKLCRPIINSTVPDTCELDIECVVAAAAGWHSRECGFAYSRTLLLAIYQLTCVHVLEQAGDYLEI